MCRPLEVPPLERTCVSRTGGGRRFGGAEEKSAGGAHFRGLDTHVSQGGGRTPAQVFRRLGAKNY